MSFNNAHQTTSLSQKAPNLKPDAVIVTKSRGPGVRPLLTAALPFTFTPFPGFIRAPRLVALGNSPFLGDAWSLLPLAVVFFPETSFLRVLHQAQLPPFEHTAAAGNLKSHAHAHAHAHAHTHVVLLTLPSCPIPSFVL